MCQQIDDPVAVTDPSGGVLGKMILPRGLAIAAAGVSLEGRERALFGTVPWWSLGLLFGTCRPVGRPVTPELDWMVG